MIALAWWELFLIELASLACGFAFGLAVVYLYARRVFRQKMGQLGSQLLSGAAGTTNVGGANPTTPPPYQPPPTSTQSP